MKAQSGAERRSRLRARRKAMLTSFSPGWNRRAVSTVIATTIVACLTISLPNGELVSSSGV